MNFLSFQNLKLPLVMTAAYFFIFPVLNSGASSLLGSFLGQYVSVVAFAILIVMAQYLGRFIGVPVMGGKGMLKAALIMGLFYFFAFGFITSVISPIFAFAGSLLQYIVVFVFFVIGMELSKYFVRSI